MRKLSVILAIFPFGDADTIAVAEMKETALESWRDYMLNGETFAGLATSYPDQAKWLVDNENNLRLYGKTERQDSGVFYRLNTMVAK